MIAAMERGARRRHGRPEHVDRRRVQQLAAVPDRRRVRRAGRRRHGRRRVDRQQRRRRPLLGRRPRRRRQGDRRRVVRQHAHPADRVHGLARRPRDPVRRRSGFAARPDLRDDDAGEDRHDDDDGDGCATRLRRAPDGQGRADPPRQARAARAPSTRRRSTPRTQARRQSSSTTTSRGRSARPWPAPPPITIPVVAINAADGAILNGRIAAGPTTLTWGTERGTFPNATGNLISSFSSYGTAATLELKPDIGAPGGLIRSTYPLELGGYAHDQRHLDGLAARGGRRCAAPAGAAEPGRSRLPHRAPEQRRPEAVVGIAGTRVPRHRPPAGRRHARHRRRNRVDDDGLARQALARRGHGRFADADDSRIAAARPSRTTSRTWWRSRPEPRRSGHS